MLSLGFVFLCVLLRVAPHPPNFAPVGATSVIAGRTMPTWLALISVFVAMFIGDAVLAWLHDYPLFNAATPFIYAGFGVQVLLGRALRKRRGGAVGAALLGSCAFFVLSNFGVWVIGDFYPSSATGLVECYVAAIPFFGATLASDLLWTVALSLAYRAIAKRIERRRDWVLVPTDQVAAF